VGANNQKGLHGSSGGEKKRDAKKKGSEVDLPGPFRNRTWSRKKNLTMTPLPQSEKKGKLKRKTRHWRRDRSLQPKEGIGRRQRDDQPIAGERKGKRSSNANQLAAEGGKKGGTKEAARSAQIKSHCLSFKVNTDQRRRRSIHKKKKEQKVNC